MAAMVSEQSIQGSNMINLLAIGLKDLFASRMVLLAASAATIGGLLFGFDQGILSISLTMPQFQEQFPETNAEVSSSASLNKG